MALKKVAVQNADHSARDQHNFWKNFGRRNSGEGNIEIEEEEYASRVDAGSEARICDN